MKVFVAGQKFFGLQVALALHEQGRHQIVGVAAPAKDERTGREDKLYRWAAGLGLPLIPGGTLRAENLPGNTDLIVSAHSHDFIGEKTRLRSRFGGIGYHPSLLPRHRGRDAIRWAIAMNEPITGGTVYRLSNRVDGGDILAQAWCWIRKEDDARSLWERELAPMGLRLMLDVIDRVAEEGHLIGVPQDEALATFEPSFDPPRMMRPDLLMLPDLTGG